MGRSNKVKLIIGIVVIVIVVGATFLYGNSQRKKQNTSQNQPNNLPTIQSNPNQPQQVQNNQDNNYKPPSQQGSQSTPKPAHTPNSGETKNQPTGSTQSSAPATAQLPTGKTPATGAADTIIPAIVLGGLTGWYIVTRRARKLETSLQNPQNQV